MSDQVQKKMEPHRLATRLISTGREPMAYSGAVNTPIFRASTILFESAEIWRSAQTAKKAGVKGVYYGRLGTPTSQDLEHVIRVSEDGAKAFLFPSGLAAVYHSLAAFSKPQSRILIAQNAYPPSKTAAYHLKSQIGVDVVLFDPLDLDDLRTKLHAPTSIVLIESPGSNTFEVCDVDAVSAIAHDGGAMVAMDNTWATPALFKPLLHGVDLSIQALTKYASGHSDMLGGSVTVSEAASEALAHQHHASGSCLAADECYSVLRGIRSLPVRLAQHETNGLTLANFLSKQDVVSRVLHPALPDNPGHAFWDKNFDGASGLFSVEFSNWTWSHASRFMDSLTLFGIGASWGGFESLVLPAGALEGETDRDGNPVFRIRIHAGLENADDLVADLEQAISRTLG